MKDCKARKAATHKTSESIKKVTKENKSNQETYK